MKQRKREKKKSKRRRIRKIGERIVEKKMELLK
jgi:hypothetical protein